MGLEENLNGGVNLSSPNQKHKGIGSIAESSGSKNPHKERREKIVYVLRTGSIFPEENIKMMDGMIESLGIEDSHIKRMEEIAEFLGVENPQLLNHKVEKIINILHNTILSKEYYRMAESLDIENPYKNMKRVKVRDWPIDNYRLRPHMLN